MAVLRMRGGSGLGDSIYMRPVAEHFIKSGHQVHVMSKWPDVFTGTGAEVKPFTRENIQILAHYVLGKQSKTTNQWQDVCNAAGVPGLPLQTTWTVRNREMVALIRAQAGDRPVILVHGGRIPMDRTDGFGKEILPSKPAFDAVLDVLYDECFLVSVGAAPQVYELKTHLSLHGQTSVHDLMDLGATCSGVVGQCSWAIPLAEIFDRSLLTVWSHQIKTAPEPYVRAILPEKVLSKPTSWFVMDDWDRSKLTVRALAFAELCGAKCAV